jgi:hypothetical protein
MKVKARLTLALLLCSANLGAHAQAKVPEDPGRPMKPVSASIVTGHVYLDDTKAPARKAKVYLQPAASLEVDTPPPHQSPNTDAGPITASVETRFDGSFTFTHVPPGSYFVIATFPGYITPFIQLLVAEDRSFSQDWKPLGPEQKKAKANVLRSLARIDLQSGLPATADIVLERGTSVSGNISFDDGGPAVGMNALVLTQMEVMGQKSWAEFNFSSGPFGMTEWFVTDDRGNYRISGLPPGKYIVEAQVQFSELKTFIDSSGGSASSSNAHSVNLPFYSGSTPHMKEAAGFSLQPREERTGEDIVIPISKLHTIKGNIVSARDGHLVNGGSVSLLDASAHSLIGDQFLTEDDPGFTFGLVFEGDYILTVPMSFDVDYVPIKRQGNGLGPPEFNARPRHYYASASMPLHVDGDSDTVTVAVPELSPKDAQVSEEAIRQQRRKSPQ